MDNARLFATALVVGIIGPLFWLGVNMFEGWLKRRVYPRFRARYPRTSALLTRQIGRRQTRSTTEQLRGPRRVGEKQLGR